MNKLPQYTIEQVNEDRTILPEELNKALDELTGEESWQDLSDLDRVFQQYGYSIEWDMSSEIVFIHKLPTP